MEEGASYTWLVRDIGEKRGGSGEYIFVLLERAARIMAATHQTYFFCKNMHQVSHGGEARGERRAPPGARGRETGERGLPPAT